MNTTTAIVATGLIVAVGRWADNKPLSMKMAIGVGALAVFLSFLDTANSELATQMALLILVGAVLVYGPTIFKKLA